MSEGSLSPMPTPAAPRIGLLGGSFDPPHAAHLALAKAALASPELSLSELRFIPAGQPWQKMAVPGARAITAAEHRAAMLRLALAQWAASEPALVARCRLDPIELERHGPSYTVQTVNALKAAQPAGPQAPGWVLIIGSDQLARLHTWHAWQELLGLVQLAVAVRPGSGLQAAPQVLAKGFVTLRMPATDLSSTQIRHALAHPDAMRGQAALAGLAPAVASYIAEHGLYREAGAGGAA